MNDEEIQIVPIIAGALLVLYFGYEINKRRHHLRKIFNVFDRQESAIAQALETLVESGKLHPYTPGQSA
jgi:hypothetical protein